MGRGRQRRRAILSPRQRARPLEQHAPGRAAGRAEAGRAARQNARLRGQDQSRRSDARSSSGRRSGAGPAISTAATTRSGAASTRLEPSARPRRARRHGLPCPGCSTSCTRRTSRTGKRLLDVFSLHYYPQGGEFSNGTDPAMQLRRNRSTRSLWDPNYTDESWINGKVALIPRMKSWVATYYPGTRSGSPNTTGAPRAISTARPRRPTSAASSAEKGWTWRPAGRHPKPTRPTYKAMKMYRNYDGQKSGFGETSVQRPFPIRTICPRSRPCAPPTAR